LKNYKPVRERDSTGVRDMQMVEPDYWKGRGRYSKQAVSRKIEEDIPFNPPESAAENPDKK
jgi:hypothetical protein